MVPDPGEREESVGFEESEEVDWRQYFNDFRQLIWPMFEAEGFTFPQAITMWRQEILVSEIRRLREALTENDY